VPLAVAKMCGFDPKPPEPPPSGSPRDHEENEMRKPLEIVVRTEQCKPNRRGVAERNHLCGTRRALDRRIPNDR
jgi:hypothetical protein